MSVAVVRMIEEAFAVVSKEEGKEGEEGEESQGRVISCSDKPVKALLGVSRIWTNENWRRLGIASLLLDTVR